MSTDIQVIAQLDPRQEAIDSEAVTLNSPDPYRFPVVSYKPKNGRLPTNIYRYSRSEVPSMYEPLFNTSRKILRKNIGKAFGTESGNISYELLMCGTSPETARPALVVKCAVNIMEKVQKVLTQERLLKRCHLRPRGAATRFVHHIKQSVGILTDQDELTLELEIYGCGTATRPPVQTELGGRVLDTFNIETSRYNSHQQFSPLYGAKVNDVKGRASATLSGIVQIGAEFYGLTTSHPFRNGCLPKSRWSKRHRIGNMKGRTIPVEVVLQGHHQVIKTKVWISSVASLTSEIPNLDWALLLLNNDILNHGLGTKTWTSERSSISNCSLKHPGWEPEVLILSFGEEPKRGILLEGTVYFTDRLSTEVGVWTVALNEENSVHKGDSGSLVIDADTGVAYGYVVARDTFGRAEIIPLHEALHQISSLTGIDHVTLADEVALTCRPDFMTCSTDIPTDPPSASLVLSRAASVIAEEPKFWEAERKKTIDTMRSVPLEVVIAPTIGLKDEIADALMSAPLWLPKLLIISLFIYKQLICSISMYEKSFLIEGWKIQAHTVSTDPVLRSWADMLNNDSEYAASMLFMKAVLRSTYKIYLTYIYGRMTMRHYYNFLHSNERPKLKGSAISKLFDEFLVLIPHLHSYRFEAEGFLITNTGDLLFRDHKHLWLMHKILLIRGVPYLAICGTSNGFGCVAGAFSLGVSTFLSNLIRIADCTESHWTNRLLIYIASSEEIKARRLLLETANLRYFCWPLRLPGSNKPIYLVVSHRGLSTFNNATSEGTESHYQPPRDTTECICNVDFICLDYDHSNKSRRQVFILDGLDEVSTPDHEQNHPQRYSAVSSNEEDNLQASLTLHNASLVVFREDDIGEHRTYKSLQRMWIRRWAHERDERR